MRPIVIVALLASVGCMKTSEKYCETHDDPAHCPPPDGAGGSCDGNEDCGTMVCELGTHTCVECVTAATCTQPLKPVCTPMHACEACTVHSDCPASLACLPDGSCAAANTVAYVSSTGGGDECSMQTPCDRVSKALATGRPVIKITGSIDENVVIDDRPMPVTLIADSGARISRSGGTILQISGTSVVVVVGLQVGGPNPTPTIGVGLSPGTTGSVDLQRVVVINNGQGGVRVENGTLALSRSTIMSNLGGGIIVRSGALAYTIRNNFVFDNGKGNGTGASTQGGALLEADVGGKFEYNTVALNSSNGLGGATPIRPGVNCAGTTNSAAGNLITGNSDGVIGRIDLNQAGGDCDFGNSYRLADPGLVGFKAPMANPPDLHLTAGSPVTVRDVAGDCSTLVAVDFDGQDRPYAVSCDLGADEYMP